MPPLLLLCYGGIGRRGRRFVESRKERWLVGAPHRTHSTTPHMCPQQLGCAALPAHQPTAQPTGRASMECHGWCIGAGVGIRTKCAGPHCIENRAVVRRPVWYAWATRAAQQNFLRVATTPANQPTQQTTHVATSRHPKPRARQSVGCADGQSLALRPYGNSRTDRPRYRRGWGTNQIVIAA